MLALLVGLAAGAVEQVFIPGGTLENRLCPNFRSAVEAGQVTAHALDALTVVGGLLASAHGVPGRQVACLEDLQEALVWGLSQQRPVLLRLCSDRGCDAALRQQLRAAAQNERTEP